MSEEIDFELVIKEAGSSRKTKTGSWRTYKPEMNEEKCGNCGSCILSCPEGRIYREEYDLGEKLLKYMKREGETFSSELVSKLEGKKKQIKNESFLDLNYCKGCGICSEVCKPKSISMSFEETKKDFSEEKESIMTDYFAPGHRTCAGCGGALAVREALAALSAFSEEVIVPAPTGCLEVTTTFFPETSWKVPYIHSIFENAAAVASGVREGLEAKGIKNVKVVCFGGDGATFDIGLQALSGTFERGHDFLYICYDNEAYSNTGVQRSGSTPGFIFPDGKTAGASTTTSPAGMESRGEERKKKDILSIMAAHDIPYAATAAVGFPYGLDYMAKVLKAVNIEGPKFIHVLAPCPVGWGYDSKLTVELANKAVNSGLWPLFEIENGRKKLTKKIEIEKLAPVGDYFKAQKRFGHLTDEELSEIQKLVKRNYQELLESLQTNFK